MHKSNIEREHTGEKIKLNKKSHLLQAATILHERERKSTVL